MVVTCPTKMEVWLAQPNHTFGHSGGRVQAYIPYSAGLLWASAMANPDVAACYRLGGFVFARENIPALIARMNRPAVVGLSVYVWNAQFSYAIGQAVKEAFPYCLLVLGGPHVPNHDDDFFNKHPWADVLIHYEGEETFTELLHRLLFWDGEFPIRGVSGISSRCPDGSIFRAPARDRNKNLDALPSPYLTGVFEHLYEQQPNHEWHVSLELDRGCPYSCTFCDWGSSTYTKVRRFGQERVRAELDWTADHRTELVVNCDANMGMFPESEDYIAYMVKKKRDTGYPRKFRASYAKHGGERIYRINKMLNDEGMSKGATLSFQSMDENTLGIIKRKNIGTGIFRDLMKLYRKDNVPTYSELIIGLPGETYNSWADSIDTLLNCHQADSIHCYLNALLPNSEQNEPEYKAKHGIRSAVSPMTSFHSDPITDPHAEQFEVVIATNTLSHEDWLKACMLAWAVQCFHCLPEGAIIETAAGPKAIEAVTSTDWVRSWNEASQSAEWSQCQESVCNGAKPVYALIFEGGKVEATADHSIYTERGWLPLSEIRSGDKVLSRVQRGNESSSKAQAGLLPDLCQRAGESSQTTQQPHEYAWGAGKTQSESKSQICRSGRSRCCFSSAQGIVCTGETTARPVVGGSQEVDFRKGQAATQGRVLQHHPSRRGCQQEICRDEAQENCQRRTGDILTDPRGEKENSRPHERGHQPDERPGGGGPRYSRSEREDTRTSSSQLPRSEGEVGKVSGEPPEQTGKEGHSLHGGVQSTIPVHRGRQLLGSPERNPGGQKSRLHSQGQEPSEARRPCPRHFLASERAEEQGRTGLVQSSGMVGVRDLGERQPGQEDGAEATVLCEWRTVQGIYPTGTKKVYDLVNVTPNNNFFANGVLVHNCLNLTQSIAVFLKAYQGLPYRSFYEALLRFARANPGTLLSQTTAHVESLYKGIPEGKEWGIIDSHFGSIIWPPEEGAFLQLVKDSERFYRELNFFLDQFLAEDLGTNLIHYQKLTLPTPGDCARPWIMGLSYNLHEYLEAFYRDDPIPLQTGQRFYYKILRERDFGSLEEYAREQVWFARKGGIGNRHKVEVIH